MGNDLAERGAAFGRDAFGHKQLGLAAGCAQLIVGKEIRAKWRTNKVSPG